ncbi:MAG: restriction endonuclease subunit S [Fusobacterium sp.]|uniref:restriction endonuclease subunit S n=1 Tax=Fusobacterium sp. TaxID=68766 RepID=UPI003FA17D09
MKIFNKNEWKKVKLGDVCEVLDSKRIPISEEKRIKGEYPYYGANGIQGYINDYIFDEELVLLAEDGGNFGSKTKPIAYKITGKAWVNNHAHVLKAKDEVISTDFLLYSLMFYDVTKLITGTTRKKLTRTGMEKITLFIPNLDIQEKITNYLQEIEKFILFRKKQLNYLKELGKSLFTKYSNRKVSKSFYIKDISSELFAGGDKPNDYSENITKEYIYPVYSNGEKKEGLLCFSKTFKVDKEALTISARGTIGFTSIRKAYFTPVVRLITLIPNKNNNIIYLKYAIEKLNLKKLGSGVAQLTIPVFSNYKLNLPPIELQNKFAERIEKIEKLKFEIEKSIEIAQNLYNSLIFKYFDN